MKLLERLSNEVRSQREKGERFERFVRAFLLRGLHFGENFFDAVWLWRDWPGREGKPDTGIDLVARERDTGRLWAIQAKFREGSIGLNDIATFLATARPHFDRLLLITTSRLTQTAEKEVAEQGVTVLTLEDIEDAGLDPERFSWSNPEDIPTTRVVLRPYQRDAVDAVCREFSIYDRGKLIMPPGSGKTLVALKIAERMAPRGCVLFLTPSIALVDQTLRAWVRDAELPLRVFAVTSDRTVGRDEENIDRLTLLSYPATTDGKTLSSEVARPFSGLTAVVATYHSIDVIHDAQAHGLPAFDLIVADEAHRTAGIKQNQKDSYYTLIHDDAYVLGKKRLYMTATPRVYVDRLKKKLQALQTDYYSMDDEAVYGPEFFRMGFGQAVEEGFLSDYRVVLLSVEERYVQLSLAGYLSQSGEHIPTVEDATRIIGTWRALSGHVHGGKVPPAKRAVVFAGHRIQHSKEFQEAFSKTVDAYVSPHSESTRTFTVKHVDGTMSATDRKQCLDWLRDEPGPDETRVLSNAHLLTEGIDVPALDAVVFLRPRRSQVDVIQAVGRVMRKVPEKTYGYVILPVVVDPEKDLDSQIRGSEFEAVWEILNALRSLDDRFDAEVRRLIHRTQKRGQEGPGDEDDADDRILIDHVGEGNPLQMQFFLATLQEKVFGYLAEKIGERRYLETWAKDTAQVARRLERQIGGALEEEGEDGERARDAFRAYHSALKAVLNPSIDEEEALSMLVQHIVTEPIFEALFKDYNLLHENEVSRGFEKVTSVFKAFVDRERGVLQGFYRAVRNRAVGLAEDERQDFLRTLYDTFFKTAFPKVTDRLGIVYTPVEVVDFIVRSVEDVLRREFGLGLADDGVVILEPFAGTGTFLTRLMQALPPEALKRKYASDEIWGNEIMLLPYYVALANIESTYHQLTGEYAPFRNLLLVDTFQLTEGKVRQTDIFPEQYTDLMEKQKNARINVIIGNPPWRAWQEDENEGNKAVIYEGLRSKVQHTYAKASEATNKNALYDSYILALRWATDRIEERGVIAFVTNSGFLDGQAASGLRKHLAQDFAKIYILNLRGNARLQGEARRKEGGGIFDQGSRAGVAVVVLVKDKTKPGPAEIYYHDIGDYLSREEKLAALRRLVSVEGVPWRRIIPNTHHDWVHQRSEDFERFPIVGHKKPGDAEKIFNLYSAGLQSNRDAWVYNFSKTSLENHMRRMIDEYNRHVDRVHRSEITKDNVETLVNNDSRAIAWSSSLKTELLRGHTHRLDEAGFVVLSMYRPFVKEWLYFSRVFNHRVYLLPKIFPEPGLDNVAIAVPGTGSSKEFGVLITGFIPSLDFIEKTQIFPLYTYEPAEYESPTKEQVSFAGNDGDAVILRGPSGNTYIRRSNISEWALSAYRKRYGDRVTREDIFHFVYGLLHSPEYRERYHTDLRKSLPRIPWLRNPEDFWTFAKAGRKLAELHLHYETLELHPDVSIEIQGNPDDPETYRLRKMRFSGKHRAEDRSAILYNDRIAIRGIPERAYHYRIAGRSPIEWVMERYQVAIDKDSGIVNDPNEWLREQGNPRYVLDLIPRLAHLSLATLDIIEGLPKLEVEE
ncbi:MAG: DEAD/DEAH box helicase family protein [Clostridiales bacterium]|nr:DEAD/DEAH box helicase family protein [Clostridiales bacterium]